MRQPSILREVVTDDRAVRLVDDGIYSVLPADALEHRYDRRAAGYDRLVGSRLYNRAFWDNAPRGYAAFARAALGAAGGAPFLDAGCGSLLFTAGVYLEGRGPIVALDRSLGMLRRARARLAGPTGALPAHITLLQGDLLALPFRPATFRAILSMGIVHLFASAAVAELVSGLGRLLTPDGRLFLTSLVRNGRPRGDRYLGLIHRAGEIAPPRSSDQLRDVLAAATNGRLAYAVKGNMAYAAFLERA